MGKGSAIATATSNLLKGGSASSVVSSVFDNIKNINSQHSVKAFTNYFGTANSGASNELITNYWFIPIMRNFLPGGCNPVNNLFKCGLSASKCEKGELEYHILDVQLPNYGIETTTYSDMTGSYNRPGQSMANAVSKSFTIQVLNTKSNIIDTVFASWISEVGASTWKYPTQPYATCEFSIIIYTPGIKSGSIPGLNSIPFAGSSLSNKLNGKINNAVSPSNSMFSSGTNITNQMQDSAITSEAAIKKISEGNYNVVTYTFSRCYPTNIELYSATNNAVSKFTRSVTFNFDTLFINAYYPTAKYNSIARILGGTLLQLGMPIANKLMTVVGDKINNVLDDTLGKLSKKVSGAISSASTSVVSLGTSSGDKKIEYKFKSGGVTTGVKTSDMKSSDIKRTFATTF